MHKIPWIASWKTETMKLKLVRFFISLWKDEWEKLIINNLSRLLAQIILLGQLYLSKKKMFIAISSYGLSRKKQPAMCANSKSILDCPECPCIQIWYVTYSTYHVILGSCLILWLSHLELSSWNLCRASVSSGMIHAHPCPKNGYLQGNGRFSVGSHAFWLVFVTYQLL